MKNPSNAPTNSKFTAAMVHEADKALVQKLRTDLKLGEKDTMRLLINLGIEHQDTLNLRAMELISAADKVKADEKAKKELEKAQAAAAKAAAKAKEAAAKADAAVVVAEVSAVPEAVETPTAAE